MTKGESKTLTFKLRNETKGALRYEEMDERGLPRIKDENGQVIGSLYLRKSAMNGNVPQRLQVKIEAA